MGLVFFLVYLLFCLLVAYAGKSDNKLGFGGLFIVSVLFTPLIAAVLVLLFQRK